MIYKGHEIEIIPFLDAFCVRSSGPAARFRAGTFATEKEAENYAKSRVDEETSAALWTDLIAAAENIRAVLAAHPEWEATVTTTSDGSVLHCLPQHRAAALEALGMKNGPEYGEKKL
jgi:hypothetical protein